MEGEEEGSQQPQLVLAHKLFLLRHPDVEVIAKLSLRNEVFLAVMADDMVSLYESLAADSVIETDRTLLDSMRKRIDDEIKKLDDK